MIKLSIVTGVRNGAATIHDSLRSVASQSYSAEHIVIDGGSTDVTLDIVRQYPHIGELVSEPDKGIYDAMNKGIRLARGEVIGILNADDFYASTDVLAKVAQAFEDPSVDCCYGDLVYVKEPANRGQGLAPEASFPVTRYWKSGRFSPQKFHWGWMPPHPTFFVRRRVYEQYGLFNLGLGSAADYELMLRFLLKHKVTCTYIPEVLVKMRAGGMSNASIKNRLAANAMDRKAWEINQIRPFPWTLYLKPVRKVGQWLARPPKP